MQNINTESIDLIVTDPPYNLGKFMKNRATNLKNMRDNFFGAAGWDDMEFDEWYKSMDIFFKEAARLMKKGGAMIMFMAIIKVETIIHLAEKYGFYYKTTGIWHKTNPMPRNMNLHFINSTEAWIYFTYKKRTGAFNNNGAVLHDFIESSATPSSEKKFGKHPTQKPESVIQFFIEILSNPDDTVLDPFMGSGTTGVVAKKTNRNFIGIELNKDYYNIAQKRILGNKEMKPKVIDLFAGVGGLSLGFENSGFDVVLANECDRDIALAYEQNHKGTKMICSDITTLDLQETFSPYANKVTVVIGGPPCQGFSLKGQRKTIHDKRNFLFKYYVEVVKLVNPRYFVMENVPNLLTASRGYFRKEIEVLFNSMGYQLKMGVLNSADYGVPQNRRRAVIIGKRGGEAPDLPEPQNVTVSIWDAISDLSYLNSGEGAEEQSYCNEPQSEYQRKLRAGSSVLHNHVATKHSNLALERLAMIPPNAGKEVLPKEHLTKSIYSGTWTRMRKDGISVTITTRFDTPSSGRFTHPFLDRAITVREAARIQSFPDSFQFFGNKGSQMKQVGNAVPPLLAAAIAEVIMKDIEEDINKWNDRLI